MYTYICTHIYVYIHICTYTCCYEPHQKCPGEIDWQGNFAHVNSDVSAGYPLGCALQADKNIVWISEELLGLAMERILSALEVVDERLKKRRERKNLGECVSLRGRSKQTPFVMEGRSERPGREAGETGGPKAGSERVFRRGLKLSLAPETQRQGLGLDIRGWMAVCCESGLWMVGA